MTIRQAEVECIAQHYDKGTRRTIIRGTRFVLPLDSANRRRRAGLVTILREFSEEEGPTEIKAFTARPEIHMGAKGSVEKGTPPEDRIPDDELKGPRKGPLTLDSGGGALAGEPNKPEPVVVDVEIEDHPELEVILEMDPEPEDLLTRRGDSSWFDVEGHDANPVQGRGKALAIAKGLLDS